VIESLSSLDRSFFLWINSFHVPWLDSSMVFLSGQLIWLPLIGFFFWYSYKLFGLKSFLFFSLFLVLALVASDVTSSYVIKNIFNRLRPCREIDLKPLIYSFGQKCGGKFGFVSSHAANSFVLISFSMSAMNLKRWFHLLWIAPILVSYSRIYLGVHYPGDIFGGMIVGLFWGLIFSYFFKSIQGANR
jgi:undecaprenyl-diphosphatase